MAIREQPVQAHEDRDRDRDRRARPARTRSAGVTLVALLLVPLLALAGLWAFVATITLGNRIRFQHYEALTNATAPTTAPLEADLLAERALTLTWLGSGRRGPEAQVLAIRHKTDAAVVAARGAYNSVSGQLAPTGLIEMRTFFADLATLPRIRAGADSGSDSVAAAYRSYDAIATALAAFLQTSAPTDDPTLNYMTQAADSAARLEDRISGAISLIGAALAAGGRMPQPERVLLAEVIGQQQLDVANIFAVSTPADRPIYVAAFGSAAFRQFQAMENQVVSSSPNRPIPVSPRVFGPLASRLQTAMGAPLSQIGVVVGAQAGRLRDSLTTQLALAAGLGLAAVGVSAFVAIRFGRRLRGELTGLYNSARHMANERLPGIVERLRHGQDVDVAVESPPLASGRITEIADVAQAFSSVQRTAVDAAVGQANLRKGVNQVFLNLSLRNQSLLHRQLGMLDTMERATNDPAALADLFRLDHLTTRMRRHAEGLIILAGSVPGRGWREPVPVLDVLRAAIAEVEDYIRVDVASESAAAVVGAAVNDVIHLTAELVENATSFSPPNTRVEIRADAVGIGFAVEIEDRGLGLTPEELAEINARLASPPEFDLAHSDQLGLFVVGQLAVRHGIRVSLRESPYGGTTAIVILPHSVIVHEDEALPPAEGASGPPSLARASSGVSPAGPAEPVAGRERAAAFSLTGWHRSDAVPVDAPAGPGTAGGTSWPGLAAPASPSPAAAGGWPGADSGLDVWTAQPHREPAPNRSSWEAAPPEATPDATAPQPAVDQVRRSVPGGTHRGLPRRVRQASMAPQLRGETAAARTDPQPRR